MPIHEVLPLSPEHGFCLLPEPSPGDIFFDLEADPFVDRGGREYLFGAAMDDGHGKLSYDCRWAMTAEEPRGSPKTGHTGSPENRPMRN